MIEGKMTLEEIDHDLNMFDDDQERPAPEIDVEKIADELRQVFKTKVHIQPAREYVYSGDAVIYFDDQGRPLPNPVNDQTIFSAWIRISFLSPYSAIVWKKTKDRQDWITVFERFLPTSLAAINARLHSLLAESGLKIVPESILYQYFPARASQLDGSAASVHAALFSELD